MRCYPDIGIRYFGRAKDLPGVKELFASRKQEEEEENQALAFYKKFMNQGPSYFGDLDENDGELIQYERQAEAEGQFVHTLCPLRRYSYIFIDWDEAYLNAREALGLPEGDPSVTIVMAKDSPAVVPQSTDATMTDETKKDATKQALAHAQAAASYIPFLSADSLMAPSLPTRAEMEGVLLTLRKKALVEEYFGTEGSTAPAAAVAV